jgi:hypothetical protein
MMEKRDAESGARPEGFGYFWNHPLTDKRVKPAREADGAHSFGVRRSELPEADWEGNDHKNLNEGFILTDIENRNLAVLIDADNPQASSCAALMAEIAQYGTASVKRACGVDDK